MGKVNITCPYCSFSKDIIRSSIPANAASVNCPRCGRRFPWIHPEDTAGIVDAGNIQLTPSYNQSSPSPRVVEEETMESPQRPLPRTLRFSFSGSASEYFGIWIVNTLLKIVTLGVYSAWAKVRQRRYFCGNILLDDSPFDYLADPIALFKGWFVGAMLFIIYTFGSKLLPVLGPSFGLLFLLAIPWLVVRSRMYNLRNLSHRNIRFNFRPNYEEAYLVYCGLVLLTPLTLGLLFPYVVYRQKKFLVENTSYGNTQFTFDGKVRDFYSIYFKGFFGVALIVIVMMIAAAALSTSFPQVLTTIYHWGKGDNETLRRAMGGMLMLSLLCIVIIYLFASMYIKTSLTNVVWNSTRLDEERLESTLRVRDMAWLYASNAVAIPLSLGLMAPWAAIRLARYRYRHLAVNMTGALDFFTASAIGETSPTGEEIGDIFGIDVAL